MSRPVTAVADLATVTDIRTARHSWDKQPRKDDPNRHVYTCRRVGCGLKKRSELVDDEWLEFWRWPDGEEGQDRKVPACRSGRRAGGRVTPTALKSGSEPASLPPALAADEGSVPGKPTIGEACEKCGTGYRLYLGGRRCNCQAVAVAGARAAHLVELRSATSRMGVPTWRGGAA